jgi:hypothetical protein
VLITYSNLQPADKVPASFMPPRAAAINHSELLDCRHRDKRSHRRRWPPSSGRRAGSGGHSIEAADRALQVGPVAGLAQGDEPYSPAMVRAREAEWRRENRNAVGIALRR